MTMQIRSYQRAFARDRRIYRIDRWTIPIPGGLPLAATAWFLVLAIVCWCASLLPGVRVVIDTVGWPATVIVAPGAGAFALTRQTNDHRTLPRLAMDHARHALRAYRTSAPRLVDQDLPRQLLVAGDLTVPGRVRVSGPGRVVLLPTSSVERHSSHALRIISGSESRRAAPAVLRLAEGEHLEAVAS